MSLKTTLLLALASVKLVGDLEALSVCTSCLEFGPNDCEVALLALPLMDGELGPNLLRVYSGCKFSTLSHLDKRSSSKGALKAALNSCR